MSIADLVGLPADELPLVGPRRVRLGVNHTAAGNRNRFQTGEIDLRVDAEWIEAQASLDRWIATTLSLPVLHRYGYPIRPKNPV